LNRAKRGHQTTQQMTKRRENVDEKILERMGREEKTKIMRDEITRKRQLKGVQKKEKVESTIQYQKQSLVEEKILQVAKVKNDKISKKQRRLELEREEKWRENWFGSKRDQILSQQAQAINQLRPVSRKDLENESRRSREMKRRIIEEKNKNNNKRRGRVVEDHNQSTYDIEDENLVFEIPSSAEIKNNIVPPSDHHHNSNQDEAPKKKEEMTFIPKTPIRPPSASKSHSSYRKMRHQKQQQEANQEEKSVEIEHSHTITRNGYFLDEFLNV